MSFISKRLVRLAAPASRLMTTPRPRRLGTTVARGKSPAETVKDGFKAVDRTVSDKVVLPGIDAVGESCAPETHTFLNPRSPTPFPFPRAAKARDAAADVTKGEAKGKAHELKGQAAGKAHEVASKAKGAAEEAKHKL